MEYYYYFVTLNMLFLHLNVGLKNVTSSIFMRAVLSLHIYFITEIPVI